jgi:hypothetical protein
MSRRGGSQAKGGLHLNDDESPFPCSFLEFRRSRERRTGFTSMGKLHDTDEAQSMRIERAALTPRPATVSESGPEDARLLSHYGLRREARPVHVARNQSSHTGLLSTRGGPNVRPDEVNNSLRSQQRVSRTKKILGPPNLNGLSSHDVAAPTRDLRLQTLRPRWGRHVVRRRLLWRLSAPDRRRAKSVEDCPPTLRRSRRQEHECRSTVTSLLLPSPLIGTLLVGSGRPMQAPVASAGVHLSP